MVQFAVLIGRPRGQVVLGFILVGIGAIVLNFATVTYQMPSRIPCPLIGCTGSNVVYPILNPFFATILMVIVAPPLAAALDRSFGLWTIAGPALASVLGVLEIIGRQLGYGAILSSEYWAFGGDALIFLGCGLEVYGIVRGFRQGPRRREFLFSGRTFSKETDTPRPN